MLSAKLSGICRRQGRLRGLCTPKRLALCLLVCYIASLIPMLVIAGYNYPSADDYTNGSQCYHVWQQGHSVPGVAAEAFRRTVSEWKTWRGCFTSAFLSAVPPHIFWGGAYRFTTWIVLAALSVAMIYFMHALLVRVFRADRWNALTVALVTLLVSVQCAPGRVEMFYWYSGAVNYTFLYGVSLIFYGLMLSLAAEPARYKRRCAAASVLGFLVGGANQMTMLNAAILLGAAWLVILLQKKAAAFRRLIVPSCVFCAGAVISIVAPGNYVRAEAAQGMNPLKAILVSFYDCLALCLGEWLTWAAVAAVAALIPVFWRICAKTAFRFAYPGLAVLSGYCLVSAMVTPPLFAVGNIDAGRAQGQFYLMFLLVLVLCAGYVTGWARKKYESSLQQKIQENRRESGQGSPAERISGGQQESCPYRGTSALCILGCLLFGLFAAALTAAVSPDAYAATSAAVALLDGSAEAYGEAQRARTEQYMAGAGEAVTVAPLPAKPETLYFDDITSDAEDWRNRGVARYYDLESVALQEVSEGENDG